MNYSRCWTIMTFTISALLAMASNLFSLSYSALGAEPFQLETNENNYQQNNNSSYPTPQKLSPNTGSNVSRASLNSSINSNTFQLGTQKTVVLPPSFLGVWNVIGQRVKVEALPEYQSNAENAFALNTNNTWQFSGNPANGYLMSSNTGIRTQLTVDKVQGNTAFIRYQHPIKNTMAQEAVVISLQGNNDRFTGLERISIVKQGQTPRAEVTYQLSGFRQ